jgi:copper chaperone CopZ
MTSAKTETFKVWGNCEMCKARIEKAVKAEGVTSAIWDVKTKMLAVTFEPSKTSLEVLSKKLASVGHDTEKYKADDKAYNALDACCKYARAK